MKAALLAFGTPVLLAQAPAIAPPLPPAAPGGLPLDPKTMQPLLLGATTSDAILAHRAVFRDNLAKVKLTPALKARWKAVKRPLTLVAVFGSWCGDSYAQVPDLLALDQLHNPFIEVHYLGIYREKLIDSAHWPKGCTPQKVHRVPTFYLYAAGPGGTQKLLGAVVENPPKAGQTMAEALLELAEQASAS